MGRQNQMKYLLMIWSVALVVVLAGCGRGFEARNGKGAQLLSAESAHLQAIDQDLRNEIDDLKRDGTQIGNELENELLAMVNDLLDNVDEVLEEVSKVVDLAVRYLPQELRLDLARELGELEERLLKLIAKAQLELDLSKPSHQDLNNRLETVKQQVQAEIARLRQRL